MAVLGLTGDELEFGLRRVFTSSVSIAASSPVKLFGKIVAIIALVGAPAGVFGQLSPGSLSNAHRDLDSPLRCTQCHTFGAGAPVFKCVDCHTEIGERVSAKSGYHATVVDLAEQGRDCATCHRDHIGRDFQLVHWPNGQQRFDHAEAGYPLEGAHARQQCRDCHQIDFIDINELRKAKVQDASRTFLGLRTTCSTCHEDEHKGQLGVECERCHSFDNFTTVTKFDHQATEFPLAGRHTGLECVQCHVETDGLVKYSGIGFRECKTCHEDPHSGAFAQACSSCHVDAGWDIVRGTSRFDHSKTDFPLVGKHDGLSCSKCHTGADFKKPIEHAECAQCHEDSHGGQFDDRATGSDCASCHDEQGFTPTTFTLDDHSLSDYPLVGKHADVECKQCHEPKGKETLYKVPFGACADCHADAHEGQFAERPSAGECKDCHDVHGFSPSTFTLSQHQQSRFELMGSHIAVSCQACHQPQADEPVTDKGKFHFAELGCAQCHKHPHGDQFADGPATGKEFACVNCHEVTSWSRLLQFDHARTEFPLEGSHATVACAECHRRADGAPNFENVEFAAAPLRCAECHEDVHAGQFDEGDRQHECSVCHTNDDWNPTRFDHTKYSVFVLDGAHENVPCGLCHTEKRRGEDFDVTVYRGTPQECSACHE